MKDIWKPKHTVWFKKNDDDEIGNEAEEEQKIEKRLWAYHGMKPDPKLSREQNSEWIQGWNRQEIKRRTKT